MLVTEPGSEHHNDPVLSVPQLRTKEGTFELQIEPLSGSLGVEELERGASLGGSLFGGAKI